MTEAFRQKQIREILDEDLRVNRVVLNREFARAKMYDTDEIKPPSHLEELVSWNIDKQLSTLQEALQNIIDNAIQHTQSISNEDINRVGIAYNLLVSYITNFVRSHPLNQRRRQRFIRWEISKATTPVKSTTTNFKQPPSL